MVDNTRTSSPSLWFLFCSSPVVHHVHSPPCWFVLLSGRFPACVPAMWKKVVQMTSDIAVTSVIFDIMKFDRHM